MDNSTVVSIEQIRAALDSESNNIHKEVMDLLEKPLYEQALIKTRGNQTKTAELLGLNRGTFRKRLKNHGIMKA